MKNLNSFFGNNLETLLKKWKIQQQDLEELLYLGRGIVSGYIQGKSLARPNTFVLLEELTGVPVYRWMKSEVFDYELPPEPLKQYVPMVQEDALHYGPTVSNTPLPTLIRDLSDRIKRLEERVKSLENCQ